MVFLIILVSFELNYDRLFTHLKKDHKMLAKPRGKYQQFDNIIFVARFGED